MPPAQAGTGLVGATGATTSDLRCRSAGWYRRHRPAAWLRALDAPRHACTGWLRACWTTSQAGCAAAATATVSQFTTTGLASSADIISHYAQTGDGGAAGGRRSTLLSVILGPSHARTDHACRRRTLPRIWRANHHALPADRGTLWDAQLLELALALMETGAWSIPLPVARPGSDADRHYLAPHAASHLGGASPQHRSA